MMKHENQTGILTDKAFSAYVREDVAIHDRLHDALQGENEGHIVEVEFVTVAMAITAILEAGVLIRKFVQVCSAEQVGQVEGLREWQELFGA